MYRYYAKKLKSTLVSYSFRLYVGVSLFGAIVAFSILTTFYGVWLYNFSLDEKESLVVELNRLEILGKKEGQKQLIAELEMPLKEYWLGAYYYLLIDEQFEVLAGDLIEWPEIIEGDDGLLSFSQTLFSSPQEKRKINFMARSVKFDNGDQLLVAKSQRLYDIWLENLKAALYRLFITAIVITLLLCFVLAWRLTDRLSKINMSIQRIMSGDLSERLEVRNSSAETENVSRNLNRMLDTISGLMDDVKKVSDNVAHDLRTPLTRLKNRLVIFSKKCKEEDRADIQLLIEEVENMLETFNALLRIARIEAGEDKLYFSELALDVLVQDVVDFYEPLAERKSITLTTSIDRQLVIQGDKNQIFQIIANLLDNAVKYTPDGGRIEISLNEYDANNDAFILDMLPALNDVNFGRRFNLTIADNGIGVCSEHHEKIFGRFYREETSRSLISGNGLGLSLVLAVMKIHRGAIAVFNNKPGLKVSLVFAQAISPVNNLEENSHFVADMSK